MKIVLASKSKVRKDILTEHNIDCEVIQSNVDEDPIKDSLIAEGATPEIISKNLAELKANKVSSNVYDKTMKNFSEVELKDYLNKITDEALYAYNVYQIEGEGKNLFEKIEGNKDTIMGLPITQIKTYMENYK